MRWFLTTLLLLILLATSVAAYFFGGRLIRPGEVTPATVPAVQKNFFDEPIAKLELKRGDEPALELTRTASGWSQPGGWPVRDKEVGELLNAVKELKSRYQPVPLPENLEEVGMAPKDKPIGLKLSTSKGERSYKFGTANGVAYVKFDSESNVHRIAPDVFQIVSRPVEAYRRRQLLAETARVKLTGDGVININAIPIPADTVERIEIQSPTGEYALQRKAPNPAPRRDPELPAASPMVFANALAEAWEVQWAGSTDRVDPAKLRGILAAIPDLWVEGFPQPDALCERFAGFFLSAPLPLNEAAILQLARPDFTAELKAKFSGFTPAVERRVRIVMKDKTTLTLRIGELARVVKLGDPEPPMNPMAPPPEPKEDRFYFAKLENNPLVFEIRGDRFNDLFAKLDELRDSQLARFSTDEAQSVELSIPKVPDAFAAVAGAAIRPGFNDKPEIVKLTKRKGNPYAERDEDRQDRWYVGEKLAEASRVTELLESLGKMEAKLPVDRVDGGKLPNEKTFSPYIGFTATVVAQAKVVEGDTAPPERSYRFEFAARDSLAKKLAVKVAGWPRINLVDDSVVSLAERGASRYRSRRLFDTAEVQLETVAVAPTDATGFEMSVTRKAGEPSKWKLKTPFPFDLDSAKANKLGNELSELKAAEFLDDAPKPEQLAAFGLVKPRFTVNLAFGGAKSLSRKLEIGAARDDKPEAYARLDGGGIFTVETALVETLQKGALELLPLQLWSAKPEQITAVGIERFGEKYRVEKLGGKWQLSGPFDAPASANEALQLATAISGLKIERYEALKADPKLHGFESAPAAVVGAAVGFDSPLTLSVTYREKQLNSDDEKTVTKTLRIGKAVPGGAPGRYAQFADGSNPAVFVVPDTIVADANKTALDWLDRNLLALDPSKLKTISVKGAETVELKFDDASKTWKAEGFTTDPQVVGNLAFTAAMPGVVRLAAYGPSVNWAEYSLDKPPVTITVSTGSETRVLKLGKELPTGERYLRIDDGPAVGVISGAGNAALVRGKLDLADRGLLNFDSTQLLSLTRKAGMEEFELASGAGWDVLKPTKFKADAQSIEELADQLGRLRAEKVASLDAKDLKPFGLEMPIAELSLTVGIENPKTFTLRIGKAVEDAKPTGDRFVQTEKTGPVKVLNGALANKLLQAPVKFKDKSIAKFTDADKVQIVRGDRKATFVNVGGTWKMTEPIATEAEQGELDGLINAAAKLRADELVAEKPSDLKPYGLDEPTATLKFFAGDKEVLAVRIGKKDADGKRAFGKLETGEVVALFDSALTNRLLGEYRKRSVLAGVDAAQAQSLAISAGTSNFAFRKAGPTWLDTTKPEDLPDTAKITETLAVLAGLKAERFVADKDANLKLYGLEKPSRVIVVSLVGGMSKTLQLGGEVGGTNGKQVYAKVADADRTDVFILSEADTAKLVRDRAGYGKK